MTCSVALLLLIISYMAILSSSNLCARQTAHQNVTTPRLESTEQIKQWAIVALARFADQVTRKRNQFIVSMLKKYPDPNRNITILFFTEMKFKAEDIQLMKDQFSGLVGGFEIIDTSHLALPLSNVNNQRYGYRYMCKFFMLDLYTYLEKYDYYMRCDTDGFILQMPYDIFSWVENGVEFGYTIRASENHGPTKEMLPPFVTNYTNECQIAPTALGPEPLSAPVHFYNNFHVANAAFFRRPEVMHFLRHCFYNNSMFLSHRWGDAPIQGYALRLFMNPDAIQQMPNMEYVHGSHRVRIYNRTSHQVKGILGKIMAMP